MYNPQNNFLFKCLTKRGIWVDWTGRFNTRDDATKWYNKHGRFFEDLGYKLMLVNSNGTYRKINVYRDSKLIGSIFSNETNRKQISQEINLCFEIWNKFVIVNK